MASENRTTSRSIGLLDALTREAQEFDFHVAIRRLESLFRDVPRLGDARLPSEEKLRLGQIPELKFEPSAVSSFKAPEAEQPGRLTVAFLGLFGPHGPLPMHLTEFVRERITHHGDRTLSAFADIFHHRALTLFHRAWATAQPTASFDRPNSRFNDYVGSLFGIGMPSLQQRGSLPDAAKLQYSAWLGSASRNAEGLQAMVSDYFRLPVVLHQFVGDWIVIPDQDRLRLGQSEAVSSLGRTAVLGAARGAARTSFG
jgi:type VI secretion system protein ImpH